MTNLLRNKPFILLIFFNLLYFSFQIDFSKTINSTKIFTKKTLAFLGVDKYQHSFTISSDNLVLYFNQEHSKKLSPLENTHSKVALLDDLIQKPKNYYWGKKSYDLNKEGMYYLVDFEKGISRNVIIFENDIISLLSSISWLVVHGSKDDATSFTYKITKIKNNKLSLTCESVSSFASKLLNQYGIQNRIINFTTLDKLNSYDNGHVLLEVKINNEFILFDLDNNRYFKNNTHTLNTSNFMEEEINWANVKFISLALDHNTDTQNFHTDKISYAGFMDYTNSNIRRWYKRVMQVPIIIEKGKIFIGLKNEEFKTRLLEYYPNAIMLNKNEFKTKFYTK